MTSVHCLLLFIVRGRPHPESGSLVYEGFKMSCLKHAYVCSLDPPSKEPCRIHETGH